MIHRRRAWSIYCLITAVQQRNDVKRMLHGHSSHAREVDLHLLSSSMEGATKPGTAALTPYSVGRWYTAWLVTVSGRHQQCLDGDSITAGAEHVQLWRWSPETVQPRKGQRLGPWERLVQRWDNHSSYALRVGKSVLNSELSANQPLTRWDHLKVGSLDTLQTLPRSIPWEETLLLWLLFIHLWQ